MANDIGALWGYTKNDKVYFTGQIEIDGKKTKIVVFKNDYKTSDKHPDYKIYLSKPKEERSEPEPPEEITELEPF